MRHQGVRGTPEVIAEGAAVALLVTAMVFGGGSRGAGDFVVHLATVPALFLGILRWDHANTTRLQRAFAVWIAAAFALIALQLVPLPADWFAALPGREHVLEQLALAGVSPERLPMTLDRGGTLRALAWFGTGIAMWALASTLDAAARLRLLKLVVLLAIPMALLGFAQAAAGHTETYRAHVFHNEFGATGLFANRNHLASFLAMCVPLALVFGREAQLRAATPMTIVWFGAAALLILGVALTYSRAGMVLATLATGAGVLLASRLGRQGAVTGRVALTAVVLTAALACANYAWTVLASRFENDPLNDLRWQYWRYGEEAAQHWWPWGSGLGSFRTAYAPFEPVDAMVSTFALHAHSDPVEIAIEAGAIGLALVVGFVGLLVAAIPRLHRAALPERAIAFAALAAVAVPFLHSLVDYPIRTLCVLVVLALAVAHLAALTPQRNLAP